MKNKKCKRNLLKSIGYCGIFIGGAITGAPSPLTALDCADKLIETYKRCNSNKRRVNNTLTPRPNKYRVCKNNYLSSLKRERSYRKLWKQINPKLNVSKNISVI